MLILLIAGGPIILIALYLWLRGLSPKIQTKVLKYMFFSILGGLLILFTVTGKMHWIVTVLGILFSVAIRALTFFSFLPTIQSLFNTFKRWRNPSSVRSETGESSINTDFIHMNLDHASGDMDGQVVKGQFNGRHLKSMDIKELLELRKECQILDFDSVSLIDAWLDRFHGDSWRQQESSYDNTKSATASSGSLKYEEAIEILGVSGSATKADIIAAHRRLIQRLHSDRGGNDYLASLVNRAKDTLLK